MRVAVCTIQHGREARLLRQHALLGEAGVPHVVVSMDGEPTAATAIASARLPIAAGAARPLAAARNLAADVAIAGGAELLVFLDVDCMPFPETIDTYVAAADELPGTILAGPIRYVPTGATVAEAREIAPHAGRPAPAAGETQPEYRYELLWSASFAAPVGVWRELGGFDEAYVGYGAEDTDFALRAEQAGIPFHWVGGADVFHLAHPPQVHDDAQLPALTANVERFRERWGYEPMPELLAALRAAGRIPHAA